MNKQEELLFAALTKDREENAYILEKPSMRGVKNSVVDKYSDQAHFIYELLQNADDAKATTARFVLEPHRLIFAHNGTRHFSVSDPANEEIDSKDNYIGDVNAITSIANSNKTDASIGKFGVGFKAVFQYTLTPEIYDPNFHFRIERFIVPRLIVSDFPGRKEDETLFVFPFDHPERDAAVAYNDISEKLRNLSYPLLFLSGLKEIEFQYEEMYGLYGKEIKRTYSNKDEIIEQICVTQTEGDELYDENLWLFTRTYDTHKCYSVGFFIDSEGHLRPVTEPAFCFFPTKEVTGLNFIIHAPFLLTDSREGIRAGVKHNEQMIHLLSILAADALERLRDIGNELSLRIINDSILNIIPFNPNNFSNPSKKDKISFLPFYKAILDKFRNTELLPTLDGYVSTNNAYWAAVRQLPQLFSNAQLADIVDNKHACWVFLSLGRDDLLRSNKALSSYLDSLVYTFVSEDAIISGRSKEWFYNRYDGETQAVEKIKGIDKYFIENQTFEWLHSFYKWLSESKGRKELCADKQFFINQKGKAVAAFDSNKQRILFLPDNGIEGYSYVHSELINNQDTNKLIQELGIKAPSLKDHIYNIILPQYKKGLVIDATPHFKLFFKYFLECSNDDVGDYIKLLKDCEFLSYHRSKDNTSLLGKANTMYFPTKELTSYFETKETTRFIKKDMYLDLVGSDNEGKLNTFLTKLGVKTHISIENQDITDYNDINKRHLHPSGKYSYILQRKEPIIDGCKEIVDYICKNADLTKSLILWSSLIQIVKQQFCKGVSPESLLKGIITYFYRTTKHSYFESSDTLKLKTAKWIANAEGVFVSAKELKRNTLSAIYDTNTEYAAQLLDFLGITTLEKKGQDLTEEQQEKIAFADTVVRGLGFGPKEALAILREHKHKGITEGNFEDYDSDSDTYDMDNNPTKYPRRKTINDINRDNAQKSTKKSLVTESSDTIDEEPDTDELTPAAVDYNKLIERRKKKSAAEIDKIAYCEELYQKAAQLTKEEKYSYAWFNILLKLESINRHETTDKNKIISISFEKVEREEGTKRTLILKHPSRQIPQFMEDLSDIPLVLSFGDQKKIVAIEVVSIKSYSLRVKLKKGTIIDGVNLDGVTSATIEAKSPAFLLEELRKEFSSLKYADDFNMKDHLCHNIEFIFGPPGTGKTTYLASNVLLPMMNKEKKSKVLVLTPTNKAADVLVKRIMEVSGADSSYMEWLVRFGSTADEGIEHSPVFRDKTFDIRAQSNNVTVTTIARFPYDYFMPDNDRMFLKDIHWDYIVIDEASMIPLANIIYPLYKKTPQKFIISGDPFQIEPIASVDIWKDENIYTLVKLDSFEKPHTEPHQYKVELLTTQYRSIPPIGDIFSGFAYNGILKHQRSSDSQRPLNIENGIEINTLNIIKYPVSKYESIYRPKRLHNSPYQVYSALFTSEFVCYLAKAIAKNNLNSFFRIGIIAPYRAQADLIDKLLASEKIPSEVDVQVGTIHSFQGDECDIIFAVFNTPPAITSAKGMFLNKLNIVNVSISRARDYLFVVMPDDDTEGVNDLCLVKKVENLIHNSNAFCESGTPVLEECLFGDPNYLENNSFFTSHHSVNVYGLPEKRYEIRAEDNAVDIQIHRKAKEVGSL